MRFKILLQLVFLSLGMVIVSGCKKKDTSELTPDVQGDVCATRLKIIASAKQAWAGDNHKGPDDTPTMDELNVFIRHRFPCPSGGTYTIGKMSELPSCSIAAHNEAFKKLMANPNP